MLVIIQLGGFDPYFDGDFVRETVVKTPIPAKELIDKMIKDDGVLPGINLGRFYPGLENGLLLAATEKCTDADVDALIKGLKKFATNAVLSEV